MRVISGKAKGIRLLSLEGMNTRPTGDRVKEALFNIIQFHIMNARILDLFGGTGALGIEALSRGASSGVFVDSNVQALSILKANLERCKLIDSSELINKDYESALRWFSEKKYRFDLIFLDPPYNKELETKAMQKIAEYNLLKDEGIIVVEHEFTNHLPDIFYGFIKSNTRKYGRIGLTFYTKGELK